MKISYSGKKKLEIVALIVGSTPGFKSEESLRV